MMMPTVSAGPIAYGICRNGCNALAVACYAAAGATFGTVIPSPATLPVIAACNAALGSYCGLSCPDTFDVGSLPQKISEVFRSPEGRNS